MLFYVTNDYIVYFVILKSQKKMTEILLFFSICLDITNQVFFKTFSMAWLWINNLSFKTTHAQFGKLYLNKELYAIYNYWKM